MRSSFQSTEDDSIATTGRGEKRSREGDLNQRLSNTEESEDEWQDTQPSVEDANEVVGYSTYKADDLKDEETPLLPQVRCLRQKQMMRQPQEILQYMKIMRHCFIQMNHYQTPLACHPTLFP